MYRFFIFALFIFTSHVVLAQETFKVGSFTFQAEEKWQKSAAARGMVRAAFHHGEKGPLVKFYHFGKGQGGGIEANMRRWRSQFKGEAKMKRDQKTFGSQKVALVEMEGTYLDGPPFGQKVEREGYRLLGAVIPHPEGDVFLKMTGPKEAMEKAKVDFEKLVFSAFPKGS